MKNSKNNLSEIFWTEIKPLGHKELILSAEKKMKTEFPKDFISFTMTHNGGKPNNGSFSTINEKTGKITQHTLRNFFSFYISDKNSVWMNNLPELPHRPDYFAFASDNAGGIICFDENTRVVYIDKDNNIETAANSFASFTDSLGKSAKRSFLRSKSK